MLSDVWEAGVEKVWSLECRAVVFLWCLEGEKKLCASQLSEHAEILRKEKKGAADDKPLWKIIHKFLYELRYGEKMSPFQYCWLCRKARGVKTYQKCQGCVFACYCSPRCQSRDWPLHREWCQTLASPAVLKVCQEVAGSATLHPEDSKNLHASPRA